MEEIINGLIEEKGTATNKEKMGVIVDKAIDALRAAAALTPEQKTDTEIQKLEDRIAELTKELVDAQTIATELTNQFNEAPVDSAKPLTVKLKKGKAKINHGVSYNGKNYTAADLADDVEIAEELFAIGSGAITLED